jgi:hypothetical protein
LHALLLVEQLRTTLQAIERFDRETAELAPRQPDYRLFRDAQGVKQSSELGDSGHPARAVSQRTRTHFRSDETAASRRPLLDDAVMYYLLNSETAWIRAR